MWGLHCIVSRRFKGVRAPSLSIQILSFSCSFQQKFGKITGWRTTPRDLASSLRNPQTAAQK